MTLSLFVIELSDVFLLLFLGIFFSKEFQRILHKIIFELCVVNMQASINVADPPKVGLASPDDASQSKENKSERNFQFIY